MSNSTRRSPARSRTRRAAALDADGDPHDGRGGRRDAERCLDGGRRRVGTERDRSLRHLRAGAAKPRMTTVTAWPARLEAGEHAHVGLGHCERHFDRRLAELHAKHVSTALVPECAKLGMTGAVREIERRGPEDHAPVAVEVEDRKAGPFGDISSNVMSSAPAGRLTHTDRASRNRSSSIGRRMSYLQPRGRDLLLMAIKNANYQRPILSHFGRATWKLLTLPAGSHLTADARARPTTSRKPRSLQLLQGTVAVPASATRPLLRAFLLR